MLHQRRRGETARRKAKKKADSGGCCRSAACKDPALLASLLLVLVGVLFLSISLALWAWPQLSTASLRLPSSAPSTSPHSSPAASQPVLPAVTGSLVPLPVLDANATTPLFSSLSAVHLVSACWSANASLSFVASSWLLLTGVTSVTVVDLSGGSAVRDAVSAALLNASAAHEEVAELRLLRVGVSEASPWLRSTALNAAAVLLDDSQPSRLLLVPCDVSLVPDFIERHPPLPGCFYSTLSGGQWDGGDEEEAAPALLFFPTHELLRAQGFDERLQWEEPRVEEVDLHRRLQQPLGLLPIPFNGAPVHRHPSASAPAAADVCGRTEPLSSIPCPSPLPLSFVRRYVEALSALQEAWQPSLSGSELRLRPVDDDTSIIQQEDWLGVARLPASLESSLSTAQRIRAVQEAAVFVLERSGLQVGGLDLASLSSPSYLLRLLTFYAGPPSLIIHAQHGLSNRLRAYASALSVASALHLRLKLIWVPDAHCRATFSDLFSLPAVNVSHTWEDPNRLRKHLLRTPAAQVWEEADEPSLTLLSPERFDVYHYVDPKGRATDVSPYILTPAPGRHVYVRASSRLNHTLGWRDSELQLGLQALVIAPEVKALMAAWHAGVPKTDLSHFIGVHVRQRAPQLELDVPEDVYTNASWAAMSVARAQTGLSSFMQLIAAERKDKPFRRFYVAADSADVLDRLEMKFGWRTVLNLYTGLSKMKGSCEGWAMRSVRCLQMALADMLLLSQTKVIHGSFWSAYSEVAGLWHGVKVRYNDTAITRVLEVLDPLHKAAAPARKSEGKFKRRRKDT